MAYKQNTLLRDADGNVLRFDGGLGVSQRATFIPDDPSVFMSYTDSLLDTADGYTWVYRDNGAELGTNSISFAGGSMYNTPAQALQEILKSPCTTAFWFKTNFTDSPNRFLLHLGSTVTGDTQIAVNYRTGPQIDLWWYDTGSAVDSHNYINTSDDEWHHLAFTGDSGTFSVYYDGVFQFSDSFSAANFDSQIERIAYGDNVTGTDVGITAEYDDIIYYNRILTAQEVEDLYYFRKRQS